MILKEIHSLMANNGFHYFDGQTNKQSGDMFIDFSTVHNGRGNSVELKIMTETLDAVIYMRRQTPILLNGVTLSDFTKKFLEVVNLDKLQQMNKNNYA